MNSRVKGLACLLVLIGVASPALAVVRTQAGEFYDAARLRSIPFLVYYDDEISKPLPMIIASHGLGGSRDNMPYISNLLAANGFVSVHLQHAGSDKEVMQGLQWNDPKGWRRLTASLKNTANAVNRFRDIPSAIDALERENSGDGPLAGRLDFDRIGMFGHSYGAKSVLVAAGEKLGPSGNYSFVERCLKAAVALSPRRPRSQLPLAEVYADVRIPLLHITGTHDQSPVKDIDPVTRQDPFRHIGAAHQYLLVLDEADHMTFSGNRVGTDREQPQEARHVDVVRKAVLKFFQAHLLGDIRALKWLRKTLPAKLTEKDLFEIR